MTDEVPEPIEGQLDVYETIQNVQAEKALQAGKKLTPAQIVALRLKETE